MRHVRRFVLPHSFEHQRELNRCDDSWCLVVRQNFGRCVLAPSGSNRARSGSFLTVLLVAVPQDVEGDDFLDNACDNFHVHVKPGHESDDVLRRFLGLVRA